MPEPAANPAALIAQFLDLALAGRAADEHHGIVHTFRDRLKAMLAEFGFTPAQADALWGAVIEEARVGEVDGRFVAVPPVDAEPIEMPSIMPVYGSRRPLPGFEW